MLEGWTNLKPWAKKNAHPGDTPAPSATKPVDVANVAGVPPENTFLRAPLRMPDGRRQYRVPTTCDGAATPAAVALAAAARAAQIVVVADGAELQIYTPLPYRGDLPQQLAAQAPDVLAVLRQQSAQRTDHLQPVSEEAESASAAADRFEERAAIVEFDSGFPRAWAEGFAAMQHAEAPAWAARHPDLWPDLVNATGLFLDRWGAQAAALGWDPEDLFGASPAAPPLARVDQLGLAFFLGGGREVVAMTVDKVSIKLPSGVVQTFRKPHKNARAPRTAPIWELVPGGKP